MQNLMPDIDAALKKENFALALYLFRNSPPDWQSKAEGKAAFKSICLGFGLSENFLLTHQAVNGSRYHLIPAWGYGFWSDVHHVVIQATLAEFLGRKPIVYWGNNSLYRDPIEESNAFEQFFEPIGAQAQELLRTHSDFYPPIWRLADLQHGERAKWRGPFSKLAAPWFFQRSESVTVAEFYTPLCDLLPWIHPDDPLSQLDENALYRRAFSRYAKPLNHFVAAAETFEQQHLQSGAWAAVHVRGTDKVRETPNLEFTLGLTHHTLERLISNEPNLRIFLMTDSIPLLTHFHQRYANRLLVTNSTRRDDVQGVHTVGDNGRKLGSEMLIETLIALRCHYFVGSMESNVALAISSLKDWPDSRIFLYGTQPVRGPNPFLYQ